MRMWTLWLAVAVFALAGGRAGAAAKPPPNIVLIFIDDMGYGDIGPFGSTKNRTPQLDRMAKEGMRFTSFYAAPVCSVSRSQVITGCYGQRVSIPGVFPPGCPNGINAEEHTIAELMKGQGYATMCIGKWHLGDQPPFLPTRHGFDHYLGIPYSNDMIMKSTDSGQPVVPLVRDEKVAELLTEEGQNRLVEIYTDEAVKFITQNKDHPFFLYLPHSAVHTPIHPGKAFAGKSANGRFGDWVEEVDWSVGRVLDTLRELKLDSNTLVMFSSDNGPWLIKGADGGSAGPLRGGKGTTWEGGVREPTIAWWPGRVAAGGVCDAIAGNIDFLPTFVSLAGGKVPADRKIDGKDISPLLLGLSKESPHEARWYYRGYDLQAVRVGPWKLAIAPQPEGHARGDAAVPASLEKPRLYNLETDIGEREDVAAAHPDIVARLKTLAGRMAAELGSGKPGPEVRPAGNVTNPATLYPSERRAAKAAAKPRGRPARPAALDTLKPGDTVPTGAAPQIAGRAFRVACEVETSSPGGVLVAHGGASTGYTLYLKEGRPVFAVRTPGHEIARVTAPEPIRGKAALEARVADDGALALSVDGREVARGAGAGLIRVPPKEDFCVGHDSAVAVDDYDGRAVFQGAIRNLKVEVAGAAPATPKAP